MFAVEIGKLEKSVANAIQPAKYEFLYGTKGSADNVLYRGHGEHILH